MGTIFISFVGRRHCVETERLPGLHSFSSAERRHSGPGGEGEDHPGRPSWVPGPLQQLRVTLPEPGPLRGESQWVLMWLWPVSLHGILLSWRYIHIHTRDFLPVNTQIRRLELLYYSFSVSQSSNENISIPIKDRYVNVSTFTNHEGFPSYW